MSNLSVENLAGMIRGGDLEGMVSGSSTSSLPTADARVQQVMRDNGMSPPASPASPVAGGSFVQTLEASIEKVNQHQHEADRAVKEMVAGRNKNIHEVMLTLERADSSLKLMMSVRNKVLEAYKEIMRMQV